MKLKVNKDVILESLQKVQTVINTRTTLPILSNVLFTAEKEKLWLSATDLDVSVRIGLEADVIKTGATTMPAKRILSIFRELPVNEIEIEVDEKDAASIRCGASYFKIIGMSEEEFPPLPKFEGGRVYTIDQTIFREMLRHTSYAASTDEARHLLNGVLLSFKGDKLTVVATDGRRMALMEQELEFPKECEADMVLPFKTVDELMRTLQSEGSLKIQATDNQIAFEFGNMLVVSKLVEGVYPNFRQVIPSQCDERVSIERDALLTSLRRVALLANEKSNSVKLSFTKNKLEITVVTPEIGEARETLPINYAGKQITIAFNPEFMMDPLKNLVSDEVFVELTDDLSPGVVKSNIPFLYVLMPMRTS
ncbi:MAG TPA: DNA polymerase III subunit beta [Verrucomicrobia bacterium]|nr:MAG: DNA polymerase III subunit beta [Lentisphaerae bacterium GWF2_57_35]HBA85194.1 DNA polymerase III subunit beta [Verrucomicrobiota bacterium]